MSNIKMKTPLKICILSYRSNPYCGGQGIYVKNLAKAIHHLGHEVDIITGPPDLILDSDTNIHVYKMDSLDLYNPENLFRTPTLKEFQDPINILEWLSVSTMGFPEPFIFGMRAKSFLENRLNEYDIIHDNQSLSYGVLSISRKIPTIATIHHPITKDREIAINETSSYFKKLKYIRWYSFIRMQRRVSHFLPKIITVSQCSKKDISEDFNISEDKIRVIPNGIDTSIFYPITAIKRQKERIVVTTSSDSPLKGLKYILKAVKHLYYDYKNLSLYIVGKPEVSNNNLKLIDKLGISNLVEFTGHISDFELVVHYAKAYVAVVPSIYEGFGLPAGEAMACGTPVVSTSGGALPEVVGEAGLLVPPKDYLSLSSAIARVFNDPALAEHMSRAGKERVSKKFTWEQAAKKTVKIYREVLV